MFKKVKLHFVYFLPPSGSLFARKANELLCYSRNCLFSKGFVIPSGFHCPEFLRSYASLEIFPKECRWQRILELISKSKILINSGMKKVTFRSPVRDHYVRMPTVKEISAAYELLENHGTPARTTEVVQSGGQQPQIK